MKIIYQAFLMFANLYFATFGYSEDVHMAFPIMGAFAAGALFSIVVDQLIDRFA